MNERYMATSARPSRASAALSTLLLAPLMFGALLDARAGGTGQCTAQDFAKAVDAAGAGLRKVNAENAPALQDKMRQLKVKKGWKDADFEQKAYDHLHDRRIADFDAQANELLVNIDGLGRPPEGSTGDCARLAELKAAGSELLAVMKAKTAYTVAKLDKELGQSTATLAAPAPPANPQPGSTPAPTAPAAPSPAGSPPDGTGWTATVDPAPAGGSAQASLDPRVLFESPETDGYTIEEIKEATRGVFGAISTNLAAVIEHAFANSGRPSAYILGQEGGGAFLAGLRYGEGTLYLRQGGSSKVYWHGPSVGYDFGAAGSRTLFLVYRLREREGLFRRFTGIDGSAYLVGGVGLTYLQGGDVIMAPIRSGLGLRLGANIGYLRFSPKPTWNPF